MEGGDLAQVVAALFERDLGVPQLEQAADADDQSTVDDSRAPPHHRWQDDGAVFGEIGLLAEAEDAPQPLGARRRRAVLMVDPAALAVAVQNLGMSKIVSREAWIAFVRPDNEASPCPTAAQCDADEARQDNIPACIDLTKRTAAEQMIKQLGTPTDGGVGCAALTMEE